MINLVGMRFGELVVTSQSSQRGNTGQIRWNCLCDCGNQHTTSGDSLRGGKSKSCGCRRKTPHNKKKDRELAVWRQLYKSTVEKRSKKLGIVSDISFDDFLVISKQSCFYCGETGSNFATDRNSRGGKTSDTVIEYNGIDRLDSNRGYTKDNCVACCKHCNIAKNVMSKDDFLDFVKKVYEYNFC